MLNSSSHQVFPSSGWLVKKKHMQTQRLDTEVILSTPTLSVILAFQTGGVFLTVHMLTHSHTCTHGMETLLSLKALWLHCHRVLYMQTQVAVDTCSIVHGWFSEALTGFEVSICHFAHSLRTHLQKLATRFPRLWNNIGQRILPKLDLCLPSFVSSSPLTLTVGSLGLIT